MKNLLFLSLITLLILQSCGGGKVSFTSDDVDKEIRRTNELIESADSLINQMKEVYSPDLENKLSSIYEDIPFFNGTPNYSVPKKHEGMCNTQKEKIHRTMSSAKEVLEEYQSLKKNRDTFLSLSEKAENSLSAFLAGFARHDYDTAKSIITQLNTDMLEYKIPCIKKEYKSIKEQEDSLYAIYSKKLSENEKNIRIVLMSESELLLDKDTVYPYYLNKEDVLYLTGSANEATAIKIWDANSRKLIKSIVKKTKYNEAIIIPQSSIYLVELIVTTSTYFDLKISKATDSKYWDTKYNITKEEIQCKKNDFMSYPITTINVVDLFQEPRKITLRSGFKAIFSGSKVSSVALNIPENTSDIAYQLRISTSKDANSRDGQFCNQLTTKTNNIKLFGKNLYEVQRTSSNLLREILNEINQPERDEEAYCSMYIFYDSNSAKKIQEGTPASSLKYDVDYSIVGTQSTNGAIPIKNAKNIYLCFANDRANTNVYIWLEAVATVNKTTYWQTKYTLVQ